MKLREIVVGREEFKKEKNERTDGRAGAGPKSESVRVMGRSRKAIINLRRKKAFRLCYLRKYASDIVLRSVVASTLRRTVYGLTSCLCELLSYIRTHAHNK